MLAVTSEPEVLGVAVALSVGEGGANGLESPRMEGLPLPPLNGSFDHQVFVGSQPGPAVVLLYDPSVPIEFEEIIEDDLLAPESEAWLNLDEALLTRLAIELKNGRIGMVL